MSETLKEMESRWALLMAATYSDGRFKGQRVADVDGKYAREAFALRVHIENLKAAEAAQPQMSKTQLEQLSWLERARGMKTEEIKDKDGNITRPSKQLMFDHSESGRNFRANLQAMTTRVLNGEDIAGSIAASERANGALPALKDESAVIRERATQGVGAGLPPSGATQLSFVPGAK